MYSRHQIGSESKEEFEEKSSIGQTKLFDQRNRLVPGGAVESLRISDWSVGGSNVPRVLQERGTTFDWISC